MSYELFDIGGKSAIVTGGASGIGRGVVDHFIAAGVNVIVADRDEAAAQATVDGHPGAKMAAVRTDVSSTASISAALAAATDRWGVPDILVNCAGILPYQPLFDTTAEDWDRCHAVNLRGSFLAIQAFANALRKAGKPGSIVNIASLASVHPVAGMPAYVSSKGGVMMLTKSAALDCAPYDIRVNAVLPGGVMTEGVRRNFPIPGEAEAALTDRVPLGRYGRPSDIAAAVAFLVSPAAAFITGHGLVVDGGYLLT